ncbi:MAG: PQQ-binding-like beta-propeller repeat protein, partial [Planctomycetaceae bacterium]
MAALSLKAHIQGLEFMGSPLWSVLSCRSMVAAMALPVAISCVDIADVARAGDWPQWRGTNRNAVSNETGLLRSWMDTPPARVWKASGIGDGYSSVVIAAGQVFTTGAIDGQVLCFALDLQSGKQRWATKIGTTSRNVMATPTVHDGFVYALDPDGELVCINAIDGTELWQRNFTDEFGGRLMSGRGYGESPLIDGHKLICTPGGEDAMLVALNRRTGDLIWKSHMPDIGEKGRDGAAFSSIVLSEAAGVRQYIQLTGRGLVGFEAKSGRYLWGYNDISNQTANIPTPLVRGDLVFSANGYHSGAVLLRLTGNPDGNGIAAQEVYRLQGNKFQNHHGGFVLIGNHIYGGHGSNNGLPTCIELQTGKIIWKRRGPGTGSASVVAADGRLYFHYQNGVVALIDASSDGYRLLGQFDIPAGGDSWSHPVVAHGKLFLREQNDLWVYDLKQRASAVDLPTSQPDQAARTGENGEHLYRFALESNASDSAIPIVTVTDAQLDTNGLISKDPHRQLQQRSSPFVLSVAGTRISDDGLQQISTLSGLVGLNVESCTDVTDTGFARLGRSKQLAVLIAPGTSVSKEGLDQLAAAPKLAAISLDVCNGVNDACCDTLGRMAGLRALVLKKTGFEPERISDAGLKMLSQLNNLEILNLYGNSVTDDGLSHLNHMSNLRELDLSLLPITDDGIRHLARLPRLRRLELLYSEGFAGTNITDAGLKSLGEFSQLTHLNLVGAKISDAGLKHISQLDQLVH